MDSKSPEDVLCAFERYQKDLNQLLQALKTGGKSGAAVSMMQSLATQDIGMLSSSVPADWESEASDFHSRLEAALSGIQRDAAVLRSDFAAAEGGLPTLSILADHISLSVSRVIGTKPQAEVSSRDRTTRPSPVHRLLAFIRGVFSSTITPNQPITLFSSTITPSQPTGSSSRTMKPNQPIARTSATIDPNRPITIDSKWSPGKKLILMSYSEAIESLRSGDHDRMAEAMGSNILNAPNAYNNISTSLASSSEESLTNILLPLLKHEEYSVRCRVPAILEHIGDYTVIPYLEEVIQHDPDRQIVKNARIAVEKIKSRGVSIASVKRLRSYTKPISSVLGGPAVTGTYVEYTAPNRIVARAFLDKETVTRDYYYIEVITPEGNLGKDKNGMY
jgi:hypothetical protein